MQAVALHALLVHSGDAALAECDLAGSRNGSPPWTPAEDALVKNGTSYRELPGSGAAALVARSAWLREL